MHKQRGELMSDKDPIKKRPLLMDRLKNFLSANDNELKGVELKPVMRLDYNVSGLALITNNGLLAKVLNDPQAKMDRHYKIRLHGLLTDSKLEGLRKGVFGKDGKKHHPMTVTLEKTGGTISWLKCICKEGNTKTVTDTLEQLHLKTLKIVCSQYGPYKLDESTVPPGAWVELKLTPLIQSLLRKARLGRGLL